MKSVNWKQVALVAGLILLAAAGAIKFDVIGLPGSPAEEEPLTIAVIPSEEGSLIEQQFGPTIKYLTDKLGREVEWVAVTDYNAVIEALKYGHADIGRPSSSSYVLAKDEGVDMEVFAFAINKNTGKATYECYVIARADRGITDLNGKSVAFVDPGSTSGYLIPMVYFMEAGIEPGEIFFAGTHSAVIEAVKNGTVDIAATADKRLTTALKEGVVAEGELEILWVSDPVPGVPLVFLGDLDEKLKADIKAAFLEMPRDVVEAQGMNEIGYIEASDSDMDPIRKIQALEAQLEK